MSQAKVDARKAYKKNRKEILAKEKAKASVRKAIAYIAMLAILIAVGYSFYLKMQPKQEASTETFYYLTQQDAYGILNPSLPTGTK